MISNSVFQFLKDLSQNNHRDWFQENKLDYQSSYDDVVHFAENLIHKINTFDVLETPSGKKSMFRIYRDVRFSKDKTPYKTHFSGSFKRAGANRRGGLGFMIKPGDSKIVGGFFGPNKEDLLLLRKQIEADPTPLKAVLYNKDFKAYFGTLQGEQLKSAPSGFSKEHPEIELLRYKQHIIIHPFTDKEVLSENFEDLVAEGFKKMMPFFDVMTTYLTTNLNGESTLP